jgi:hypothetical protein
LEEHERFNRKAYNYYQDKVSSIMTNIRENEYYTPALPRIYRRLLEIGKTEEEDDDDAKYCNDYLESLLQNNLLFHRTAMSGEGSYKESFLSAAVEDEDLPWDLAETDW